VQLLQENRSAASISRPAALIVEESLRLERLVNDLLCFVRPSATPHTPVNPGYDLKDFFSYEGGIGYQATDRLLTTLLMQGATELTDLSSGLLETRLKIEYRLTGRADIQSFLAAGLTSGSPDFGAGLSISYDF